DFLGFNIRKFPNNTLLTQPSDDAKKRFCDKIRKVIESNKTVNPRSAMKLRTSGRMTVSMVSLSFAVTMKSSA
ncbi:hypothetical protein CLI75_12065, partial [Porphyromonas gingivalis]|uniref:hypothetical protein n=1 Tax=Porphyromonas gingivalis TaxID=837 RepID=UPI000BE753AE